MQHQELLSRIARLEQDKKRIISDAQNIKRDFGHRLGRALSSYFLEAKDTNYQPGSVNEEILLGNLRGILKELEKFGITTR